MHRGAIDSFLSHELFLEIDPPALLAGKRFKCFALRFFLIIPSVRWSQWHIWAHTFYFRGKWWLTIFEYMAHYTRHRWYFSVCIRFDKAHRIGIFELRLIYRCWVPCWHRKNIALLETTCRGGHRGQLCVHARCAGSEQVHAESW